MSTPTRRAISTLFGFFQSNQAAGSITPDRVQDLVQSLTPGFARISSNGATGVTSIASVNEWTKINIATTLADNARGMSMPQSNRILCNCPVPALALLDASISVSGGNNKTYQVAFAKNGTIEPESVETIRIGSGGDTVSVTFQVDFEQTAGDFVEAWIRNTTDSTNPTVSNFYMRSVAWVL